MERVAEERVLVPNVFYRSGRLPVFGFETKWGEERTMQRVGEITGALTPAAMERDGSAYVDFLSAQPTVSNGETAVVGYCLTGGMAMRVAAARRDKIALAASFHGGRLFTDAPTSPHLLLPRIKSRLYFGHAVEDASMPPAAIVNLENALAAWGGVSESETYAGALHGWTVPGGAAYNEPQAERAFGKLVEVLGETLR